MLNLLLTFSKESQIPNILIQLWKGKYPSKACIIFKVAGTKKIITWTSDNIVSVTVNWRKKLKMEFNRTKFLLRCTNSTGNLLLLVLLMKNSNHFQKCYLVLIRRAGKGRKIWSHTSEHDVYGDRCNHFSKARPMKNIIFAEHFPDLWASSPVKSIHSIMRVPSVMKAVSHPLPVHRINFAKLNTVTNCFFFPAFQWIIFSPNLVIKNGNR